MPVNEEQLEQSLNFLIANALSDALTLGLSDGLGAAAIHINSSIPRKLKLSIANTLPVEVQIVGQPGPASPSNFHFHIQFVNNQCFMSPPPPTLTTPKWAINTVCNGAGYITDIYLLSTATISLEPTSSAGSAGRTTEVELLYTEASLYNVAVEVLLVGVEVGQNVVALINSNPCTIQETETIHLTTFTDAGAPTPLIATLVQPRTILNDGTTTSQLLLRLVNTLPDPVAFATPPDANSPTPTAVQLSVDLDDAAAWALCKADEAGSILVTPPAHWTGVHEGVIGTGRKTKTWLFRPVYAKTNRIEHNSSLEFLICGVKSSLPPGFTNLYVTLQEFPNYGTQTAVAQIEKSPIIYNRGLVGIGTNEPKSTLSVKGGAAVGATYANSVAAPNGLIVEGNVGIGVSDPAAKLHVGSGAIQIGTEADSITLIDSSITHKYGTQENPRYTINRDLLGNGNAGIGFGTGGEPIQISGSAIGIPKFNALAFYTSGGSNLAERVRIDSFGNVGIGTNEPRSTLSVKGGAAVGATYANSVAAPNGLIVEGNVGIGTNEPKSTLSVKGGAAIGSTYADTDVAPPNSLLVEGNVGIGTKDPKHKLEVAGDLAVSGNVNLGRSTTDSLTIKSQQAGKTALTVTQTKSNTSKTPPENAIEVGSFGMESDQYIAVKVAGGSLYSAGIKLKAFNDQVGFTIAYNDMEAALQILRQWDHGTPTPTPALEIKVDTGNITIPGDLVVGGRVWFGADSGKWRYLENDGGHNRWAYWVYGTPAPSDLCFKREVQPVPSALDKVRSLRGVTFSWNEDALQHFTRDIETTLSAGPNATESENQKVWQAERDKRRNQLSTRKVGVLAQDVEAVLPEAVTTDPEGYKSVRYDDLIPLLIEAIKEQHQVVARQQREIEQLKLAVGMSEPQGGK